jgi:hypothetical protein
VIQDAYIQGISTRSVDAVVDRIQHSASSFNCGNDFIGFIGPSEWPWVCVGLGEEAFDGGLEFDNGAEHTALEPLPCESGEDAADGVEEADQLLVSMLLNEAAVIRISGALLLEQNDEWAVQRARYMTPETIAPPSDGPLISRPPGVG